MHRSVVVEGALASVATTAPELEAPRKADAESGVRTRPLSKSKTILLVDDDGDFLSIMNAALTRRGHQVLFARGAAKASAIAETRKLDVIVVDGLLPDADGITWIAGRRKKDPNTTIVFVSAFAGFIESVQPLLKELRIALVAQKPVDPQALCDEIERCDGRVLVRTARLGPKISEERALVALRTEYARALPGKLRDLADVIRRAQQEPMNALLMGQVRDRAHKLRGAAGSYGFPDISLSAAIIEESLARPRVDDAAAPWAEIDRALAGAFATMNRAPPSTLRRGMPLGVRGARILVVATDPDFLALLGDVAQRHLLEVVRAGADEALTIASAEPPDAAIIELCATSSLPAFEVALRLRALPACGDLPIAFVSAEDGVAPRIAAARAGASLYLTTPADPEKLGLAVRQLLAIRQSARPRVLVVSEDDASCTRLSVILERCGKIAFVARSVSSIMAALDDARPDLVLLDLQGPLLGGLDLCRLIRNSPEWQALPTVMFVEADDLETRLAAARAGADDVLVRPVAEQEIEARIDARLDRMRMLRERFDKDVLTDLPLRRPFLERLSRCMAESVRHGRPLTLALLDVDVFKSINDRHGHPTGDRVLAALGNLLAARFRTEDICGRWGGEEFALAFPAETSSALHAALTELLNEFAAIAFRGQGGAAFHVTFSAGMAAYPDDGASIQALLDVADRRLYEAKRMGRARVVSTDVVPPARLNWS